MKKTVLAALFFAASVCAAAQTSNTYYARNFAGQTVGAKVTAAQAQCIPDTNVPCIIVIDPTLATYAVGNMPAACAQCYWQDYRTGGLPFYGGRFNASIFGQGSNLDVNVSPRVYNRIGDSITYSQGGQCTRNVNCWPDILQAMKGWTAGVDISESGDRFQTQLAWMFQHALFYVPNSVYTALLGTNDATDFTTAGASAADITRAIKNQAETMIVLATTQTAAQADGGNASIIFGQQMTQGSGGSCTLDNGAVWGTGWALACYSGRTLTASLNGSTLYLAVKCGTDLTATYTVTIDSGTPSATTSTTDNTYGPSGTNKYYPCLYRYPLGDSADGTHTITVTPVSGGTEVFFVASNGNAVPSLSAPIFAIAEPYDGGNATDAVYAAIRYGVRQAAQELSADRLPVVDVPLGRAFNCMTNQPLCTSDHVHPHQSASQIIANVFAGSLSTTATAPLSQVPADITWAAAQYNLPSTVGCVANTNNFPCLAAAPTVLVNQAANISTAVALLTSVKAGLYSVLCDTELTQAATTSSSLPYCFLKCTDGGVQRNVYPSQIGINQTINTTGVSETDAVSCQADSGSTIYYATNGYASVGATPMQYKITFIPRREN